MTDHFTLPKPKESACSSCGAKILWARTQQGRRIPLDAKGERRFTLSGRDGGDASYVETFASHFSTCPNADAHRRAKA